ncbi:MAG: hypothetical protein E7457_04705 [Ruminococcaceae bacterium]|nr:hypothetical protein [Oscillospiraceae bacterium]
MKFVKQHQFWISLAVGTCLFAGTFPFYHDMYIPPLFTALCICLNLLSAVLFGAFLYCRWTHRLDNDGRSIFLWLTAMQSVGHGIFAMMNWGSWLYLTLSAAVLVLLLQGWLQERRTGAVSEER